MTNLTSGPAAALWTGLLLLLMLALSVLVVRQRRRHRVSLGDDGVPELARAVRAFGNASEYIPAGIAALVVMAQVGAPALAVHIAGLTLFLGRATHAVGLSHSGGASLPRAIGIVMTWLAYVFAAAVLLVYAVI